MKAPNPKQLCIIIIPIRLIYTGVAKIFDWEGLKTEKSCDVSLATVFGDVNNNDDITKMTS